MNATERRWLPAGLYAAGWLVTLVTFGLRVAVVALVISALMLLAARLIEKRRR